MRGQENLGVISRREFTKGIALTTFSAVMPVGTILYPTQAQANPAALMVLSSVFSLIGSSMGSDPSAKVSLLILDSIRQIAEQNEQIFLQLLELDKKVAAIPNETARILFNARVTGAAQLYGLRHSGLIDASISGTPIRFNSFLNELLQIHLDIEGLLSQLSTYQVAAPGVSQVSLLYSTTVAIAVYLKSADVLFGSAAFRQQLVNSGAKFASDEDVTAPVFPSYRYSTAQKFVSQLCQSLTMPTTGWLTQLAQRSYPLAFDLSIADGEDLHFASLDGDDVGISEATWKSLSETFYLENSRSRRRNGDNIFRERVASFAVNILHADHVTCTECAEKEVNGYTVGQECYLVDDRIVYAYVKKVIDLWSDGSLEENEVNLESAIAASAEKYRGQDHVSEIMDELSFDNYYYRYQLVFREFEECDIAQEESLSDLISVYNNGLPDAKNEALTQIYKIRSGAPLWWNYVNYFFPLREAGRRAAETAECIVAANCADLE